MAAGGSVHIIGSRQLGGADRFSIRLIEALHDAGDRVVAINRPGSPIATTLSTDITQYHLPLANQWDVWSVARIRQLVRRLAPQVVQTYMGRATRLTRLGDLDGAVHIARLGGYYKLRGYYFHADAWVGNTRGVCDYLLAGGLPAARIHQIGNFVPDPKPRDPQVLARLSRHWQLTDDALIIFSLGRLVTGKGFDDLLSAFARLPRELAQRPLRLLIAGAGPQASSLQALARQLGVEQRVRWLGWCDDPGDWFHCADLFVCPSRHETLGNVILEAWSYGKAVLSTATKGARELIDDQHNGWLTPCEDVSQLAASLREVLLLAPDERTRLGSNGHEELTRRHGKAVVVDAYRSLYGSVTKRR